MNNIVSTIAFRPCNLLLAANGNGEFTALNEMGTIG